MKITINLEGWEREALILMAQENLRGPSEQAHWMLRQELGMRGHAMQIDGKESEIEEINHDSTSSWKQTDRRD